MSAVRHLMGWNAGIRAGQACVCSVAWKTSQYGRIWEYLRRDFDVEARFETIEDKVLPVQCRAQGGI